MSNTRQSKRLSTSTPKAKRTLLSTPTKKTRSPKSVKPVGRLLRTPRKDRDIDTESVASDHSFKSCVSNDVNDDIMTNDGEENDSREYIVEKIVNFDPEYKSSREACFEVKWKGYKK
jgi:hypothetical protein